MHEFHDYLAKQIGEKLKKRSVVVVYDERREFVPFFNRELEEVGAGYDGIPRVFMGEEIVFLARFEGSFLGLKNKLEPIAARDSPDPVLVYIPGVTKDHRGSPLMELEKSGIAYEIQPLRRLARNVLRSKFTDGQIDEMLQPASIGYDDIVSFLTQVGGDAPASVLRTIFGGAQSEALLAAWLARPSHDAEIVEKGAISELVKLIGARLGLEVPADASITDARAKTLRYVLVSEFRSDLSCAPPGSVAMVPTPPGKDEVERVRDIAEKLRRGHPDDYVNLAVGVERDLQLGTATIQPGDLGSIDTFRFEERALLSHAGRLLADKKYVEALGIVNGRSRSFWVDRDVERQAQWEACRLTAELGREIDRVRPAMAKLGDSPAKWVEAYSAEDGWHHVDGLQRRLETWVANMGEEPETEKALGVVRHECEELLKKMADRFATVLANGSWVTPGALHQTSIYPEVVEPMGGRVAYFFVDAMRYEMGVELARQLEGAKDLTIRAAIAALPSITPVGMAALLPGASASFSVVDHKGKLAAKVEGTCMAALPARQRFLRAKVPMVADLPLGNLLGLSSRKLAKKIADAPLVVIRSQEIDLIGEADGSFLAKQVMSQVIGNISRAIKKLAKAGIENFVITADHGHQFSARKDDDMKTDKPGGDTLDLHRRCWVGHGGKTPAGTVRVSGVDLGYDTDLDFVFPTGLGVFKAGGGLAFHHGSISLQELIIPVLSLRIPAERSSATTGRTAELRALPKAITNRTFGVRVTVKEQLKLGVTAEAAVPVRVFLVSDNEQVGEAGMAIDADFDRATGVVSLRNDVEASVGLMLKRDDCQKVRVVVQDPQTDAVLARSDEIPVKLGI